VFDPRCFSSPKELFMSMAPGSAPARYLRICCAGSVLCEHRIARAAPLPVAGGIDRDELQTLAHARKSALPSPQRRAAFGLAGAFGLGSLLPLAGCATASGAGGSTVLPATLQGRTHVVESTRETVRVGAMDPNAPPAATVDSGDVVHYPNTWVNWADEAKYGMQFEEREPIRKRYSAGPYSLVGPVAVRGAEPGDWIECRMLRLRPIEWGWNSAPMGVGALPSEFKAPYLQYFRFDEARTRADFKHGISYPLAPTQGVIATMPAGDKPVSGILSGPYGGNVVLRELTEGASIFLPVQRSGGLVWTGDSHAAQGDGVVNQTAIETAMQDMRIQFVLHKRAPLKALLVETPTHWIGIGHGASLDAALSACLLSTIDWLAAAAAIARVEAYSVLSIAGSFRITQYAHQLNTVYANVPAKGVHVLVPKAVFAADRLAAIASATRSGS
jgi:acetamidase/formamidase